MKHNHYTKLLTHFISQSVIVTSHQIHLHIAILGIVEFFYETNGIIDIFIASMEEGSSVLSAVFTSVAGTTVYDSSVAG